MAEDYKRPDPDALLARVLMEEQEQGRGKLKVFLGYVAGVGKTFAMLEAAHQRKMEGVDVVVGYVETHGRTETEAMLEGLEILPRKRIEYRSTLFTEMDLDAALARRPGLILVDELAHTNIPGSRHPKRYQDIEELLNAGIDVYTTVNIQHIESLNDVVQQITGARVRETVPDTVIDQAYEIKLVDLPTDELQQRLKEGKVYVPDQAALAIEKFFRKGNLTALRELSLRRAAHQVDDQMLNYMQSEAIPGPWPAGERVLVCLSSHPLGERLVRAARRLAHDLDAEWIAAFVETPGHLRMPPENRERIQRFLLLAEQLGASIVHLHGQSVADAVIDYSRQHNITKIVAGKPLRPRWFEMVRGSVIDHIIRKSGPIDVYVVSEVMEIPQKEVTVKWLPNRPLLRYVQSLIIVAGTTLVSILINPYLEPTNLAMLYLMIVVLAAVFLGRGPAMLASLVSVLAFDFFLVDPKLTLTVDDTQYLITFAALLVVGLVISNLASLLRDQVDTLRRRERAALALNSLSRELAADATLDQVLETVIQNVCKIFGREAVILLPEDAHLSLRAATGAFTLDDNELAVAEWAFRNGQTAGRGTETLPAATVRFIPLKTVRGIVGILGIKPSDPQSFLTVEQRMLLDSFVSLSALAVERGALAEQAAQNEMLRNTEKLQTALLNSISHELRTPLASITGVLSTLRESEKMKNGLNQFSPKIRIELLESAAEQAHRLNRLVENLLDMARLEAGAVRPHREPAEVQDMVGAVLNRMADRLGNRPVSLDIAEDFPPVLMDVVLVGQVMVNLLDNACKYSPQDAPILITAREAGDNAEISISDKGPGIPTGELEHIFDKFYHIQQTNIITGIGLGLSICKGMVEVLGGRIWAQNNPDGGAAITFTLPLSREGLFEDQT